MIKKQIRAYIANNILLGNDMVNFDDDDSFRDNGILDSLDITELVLFVEDNFGLTVEDHEITITNFDSVNNLVAYMERKLSQKSVYPGRGNCGCVVPAHDGEGRKLCLSSTTS